VPTYQYTCTACDHDLEAVQSFSDDPLTECPECSGRLRKVFSAVGVVFKGSGFYRTDSRATANGNGSKNGGSKSGDSPSGSDSSAGSGSSNSKSEKSSGSKDSSSSTSTTTSKSSSAA
jgi:putative FmdB family regulatory protein